MTALRLTGVTKRYGKTVALDALSLEVPSGTVCGLVGPNGAGKTTCFGVVGGVIRPDAGVVDLLGEGPFDPFRHGGRVTLLPQDCELSPHAPIRALLVHYARLQGATRADADRDVDRVLESVRLTDRARSLVRHLSHGMRRRVAVAQALLGDPRLVMLDEPTSGLDPDLVVLMRDLFLSQRGERTMVISSHVLADLEATCDHVIFMRDGKVVRAGSMSEVTGRARSVRVLLEPPLPGSALESALSDLPHEVDGDWIAFAVPYDEDVADVNERALRALLDGGARVLEVHRGASLERTWMETRDGVPSTTDEAPPPPAPAGDREPEANDA